MGFKGEYSEGGMLEWQSGKQDKHSPKENKESSSKESICRIEIGRNGGPETESQTNKITEEMPDLQTHISSTSFHFCPLSLKPLILKILWRQDSSIDKSQCCYFHNFYIYQEHAFLNFFNFLSSHPISSHLLSYLQPFFDQFFLLLLALFSFFFLSSEYFHQNLMIHLIQ